MPNDNLLKRVMRLKKNKYFFISYLLLLCSCFEVEPGDYPFITKRIANSSNVNQYDVSGTTPFLCAVMSEKEEDILRLIEMGADVNLPNKERYPEFARYPEEETPLIMSVISQNYNVAKILLDNGANIEGKDKNGNTALIMAACFPDMKILRELVLRGASVKAVNINGENAVMEAVKNSNKEALLFLIEQGADINKREATRREVKSKNTEFEERLMQLIRDSDPYWELETNTYCWRGDSPLMVAVRNKEKDIAEILISHGANKSLKNSEGKTARQIAKEEAPELLSLF